MTHPSGRYRTYSGPHNQPSIDEIIADLMERVKNLESPRRSSTSQSGGLQVSDGFHAFDLEINEVLGTNDIDGHGLFSPWLGMDVMTAADYNSPSQTTTSATFVPLFYVHGYRHHDSLEVRLRVSVPAANVGEFRVMDNTQSGFSVQVGSTQNISGAYTDYIQIIGNLGTYYHQELRIFTIEARRVSGTGAIGMAVAMVNGRASL